MKSLDHLFVSLFSTTELREFLQSLSPEDNLLVHLPDGASPAQVASKAAELLDHRGLVGLELHRALLAARPRRRTDIDNYFSIPAADAAIIDPVWQFLGLADSIYRSMAALQTALDMEDQETAEGAYRSVIAQTRSLYECALLLRTRGDALSSSSLTAFESVFSVIAHILKTKQGDITDIARAIHRARKSLPGVSLKLTTPVDPRGEFLQIADSIYQDLSTVKAAIAFQDQEAADKALESVPAQTRALYEKSFHLRTLGDEILDDSLATFDAVYEVIAELLNEKSGNLFMIAAAIQKARATYNP